MQHSGSARKFRPTPYQSIAFGEATIVPHADGGWALPGGRVTQSEAEARRIAVVIHEKFLLAGLRLGVDKRLWKARALLPGRSA